LAQAILAQASLAQASLHVNCLCLCMGFPHGVKLLNVQEALARPR